MGKPTGFKEQKRFTQPHQTVAERIQHYREFYQHWTEQQARDQGSRCMNCGVPFCHTGCPLGNLIPDWNDLIYRGRWKEALIELHSTNNFPEFTGRICPAPCEEACTLAVNQEPVTIEHIEKSIADRGWQEGWITPQAPSESTGKTVAVVGSGPAGLAAAQQLCRSGHAVTVFERDDYIGGLLRLGIPDFKLGKDVVQRRVDQMEAEGVTFQTGVNVGGEDFPAEKLLSDFDAVVLSGGSTVPRDLPVPGRELEGVHFAMDFLKQQNLINAGETIPPTERISADGRRVVILGGGDTGSDCLGTSHRQGAEVVYQYELLSEPDEERTPDNPWPYWPMVLRTSSSQEEGVIPGFDVMTTHLSGEDGQVTKLHAVKVNWGEPDESGRSKIEKIEGSEFEIEVDLVLLAMGFLCPDPKGLLADLRLELDPRGNIVNNDNKMTSVPGVFAAGDMARGQSLVVWAIAEGREAARGVDQYLMGSTGLPHVLEGALPRS